MVNWQHIDTVLLDMDGTLLDLHFDNYFWREHVPLRYSEKHEISIDDAKRNLYKQFCNMEGKMQWYCVDYWTETLDLDIAQLKAEVAHLIAIHPNVEEFLKKLQKSDKTSALVTNAHQKSLDLKMDKTALDIHFDHVLCSHDFGLPKEEPEFWQRLRTKLDYNPQTTLLVDDSLSVLRSAREYGINHLLSIHWPDSKSPKKDVEEFEAIHSFADLLPVS